jgi:hypothetical protein
MAGSAEALEVAGALVPPGFSGDDVVYVGRRNDLPPLRVTSAVRFTSELLGPHLAPVRRAIERVVEVPALALMLLASAAADRPLRATRLSAPRLDGVGHQAIDSTAWGRGASLGVVRICTPSPRRLMGRIGARRWRAEGAHPGSRGELVRCVRARPDATNPFTHRRFHAQKRDKMRAPMSRI